MTFILGLSSWGSKERAHHISGLEPQEKLSGRENLPDSSLSAPHLCVCICVDKGSTQTGPFGGTRGPAAAKPSN